MRSLLSTALLLLLFACKHEAPASTQTNTPPDPGADTVSRANPWKEDPCALVTEAEIADIFGIDPKKDVLSTKSKPSLCLRTWMRPNWKVIETENDKPGAVYKEFRNLLTVHVIDYNTPMVARQQVDLVRKNRREVFEEDVPGLGDDAVWSTSTTTLYVRKGQFLLNITLSHLDAQHDNLAKAKDVAVAALRKM